MSEALIKVEGLSKKFCRDLKRSLWYGVQDLSSELLGRRHGGGDGLRPDEFWAVRDISFELRRGECLGLIGHNGAGKTTLLRILNGLIKPDQGRIEMRGRVGALIALGAGFNPILTGRENIYINAAILGMDKRRVDSKLDEIIAFAEIGDFIDTPVQNYSSGMSVRLGFAVAAVLIEPDILFLDEVLAVGDIGFVIKCLNTVRHMTSNSAVVFVSHNMQHVSSFCTRVMVMKSGVPILDAQVPADAIALYHNLVARDCQTFGSGEARVEKLSILINGEKWDTLVRPIPHGASMDLQINFSIDGSIPATRLLVSINEISGTPVLCAPISNEKGNLFEFEPGHHSIAISLGRIELNAGRYFFGIALSDMITQKLLASVQGIGQFEVYSDRLYWGNIVRPTTFSRLASTSSAWVNAS